jgi:hypothetical protein
MTDLSPTDPDFENTPSISVIVPVFNGGPGLKRCLNAIKSSSHPVLECLLIDDLSTDESIAEAVVDIPVRIITMTQKSGPGVARNRGAAEAVGDILVFIDADVELHPDALGIAVEAFANDSGLSAIFGSYDDQPGHSSFLSQYRNLFHHWVHQTGNSEAATFWAGCGAIRRDVFMKMDGFSHDYCQPCIEDIELGTRMHKAGHKIRLEKRMLAKRMKHWAFLNLLWTDLFHRGVPWMALVLSQHEAPTELNLSIPSRAATGLAGLFCLAVIILVILGQAAAVIPVMAFLLAAIFSIGIDGIQARIKNNWPISMAILVIAPVAAFAVSPTPWFLIPLALLIGLIWTHRSFYRLLIEKRGYAFAIGAIPMQLLFFISCGLAVVIGLIRHLFGRSSPLKEST